MTTTTQFRPFDSAEAMIRHVATEKYAWPGGYVFGLVLDDGGLICPTCVEENIDLILDSTDEEAGDGWQAIGFTHAGNEDDHHQQCAHCEAEMVVW